MVTIKPNNPEIFQKIVRRLWTSARGTPLFPFGTFRRERGKPTMLASLASSMIEAIVGGGGGGGASY